MLLEKFLGPSHNQSQDDLVSADGTLKRADVSLRPNRTWHGTHNSNAVNDQRNSASKVSAAAVINKGHCTLCIMPDLSSAP